MNGILGYAKLNQLRILLDLGAIYSIIIGKHAQNLRKK